MRAQIILWSYKPRKDGTCNIKIYVGYEKEKKYFKTKFHVLPVEFDSKKGIVKKIHPNHIRINAALQAERKRILDHLIEFGDLRTLGEHKKESFIDFLTDYRNEIKNGFTRLKPSTAKNYSSLITKINQYRYSKKIKDLYFDDITMDFYASFKKFLLEDGNCGMAGFGKHIKVIKTIMRISQELGLHKNEAYKSRLFHRPHNRSTSKIFLTEDEIQEIEKLDLSSEPSLDKERDRFLISYYFLMRYDDSRKIKKQNIFEKSGQKYLRYKQDKTGRECIVPVKNNALKILRKREFHLNLGSNQQSNRDIKIICATAGINQIVKQGDQEGQKWKFVTTHTARRSAATNLALQNVSIKIIADLGGWLDIDTLRTYLRSSGLDSAIVAKDLDFFQ